MLRPRQAKRQAKSKGRAIDGASRDTPDLTGSIKGSSGAVPIKNISC
jgi:hypothetical protein